jgi:O-antigen/teichoic acid export membrane protein
MSISVSHLSSPVNLRHVFRRIRTPVETFLISTDERARAQRDAISSFAVRIASAGIAYLSQAVLARWIGTHDYGIYVFLWTWVLVLGGISSLGLSGTTVRLLPQYSVHGDYALSRGLAQGVRVSALFAGLLVSAFAAAAISLFGSELEPSTRLPAYLILACIPLYAFTDVQTAIARGRDWTFVSLLPPYIVRPSLIVAFVAIAHISGFVLSATTAAAAAIGATLVAALAQAIFVNRGIDREIPKVRPHTDYRTWFATSLPFIAVYACELVMQNTDVLIISRYMTPSDIAVYFAAAKTMALILFVHYAVGSAVATRFSALHAKGDRESLEAFVCHAAKWTFWPSLAGAAIILAAGKPLLALFGPDFTAGYPIMFVLVIGFLVRSAMGPADILLSMLGEQRLCAILLSITALLNIALNLALVPRWGLIGAATATSIALVAGALMSYVAARRRLKLDIAIWHTR